MKPRVVRERNSYGELELDGPIDSRQYTIWWISTDRWGAMKYSACWHDALRFALSLGFPDAL